MTAAPAPHMPAPQAGGPMMYPGKIRQPGIVILLTIVTLGIYAIIYYYSTFEELRRWRGEGWSGGLYLLFNFLFPFPLIAVPWLLPGYVRDLHERYNMRPPYTGALGFWVFLPLIGGIIWIVQFQNGLNDFWRAHGATG